MSVEERLKEFKDALPNDVKLVAVSKTHSTSIIMQAYDMGQRAFGENRVQELIEKAEQLPEDVEWHMIGHLQSNKVKYIAPYIHLIHSVDSLRLLRTIQREGKKNKRVISLLLQVHIAQEDSKFGLTEEKLFELIEEYNTNEFDYVEIKGLMGMATFTEDENLVRSEFKHLKELFNKAKVKLKNSDSFSELSMGMTNDYLIAIEEGSTIVRIGSAIFGAR
ncbi:MAG TPA: YggS family pyridoxal phosphate-dependent enzyme [Marinilabiliaceae bacterium]|nr:YggS family pyridoxal phosphate-dependent enzyme [Marinilabiliaceae bacterium]